MNPAARKKWTKVEKFLFRWMNTLNIVVFGTPIYNSVNNILLWREEKMRSRGLVYEKNSSFFSFIWEKKFYIFNVLFCDKVRYSCLVYTELDWIKSSLDKMIFWLMSEKSVLTNKPRKWLSKKNCLFIFFLPTATAKFTKMFYVFTYFNSIICCILNSNSSNFYFINVKQNDWWLELFI